MCKLILSKLSRLLILLLFVGSLSGCVGKIVGAAVDTTIEVVKVPFKVAGAAVDVVAGDGKKDKGDDDEAEEEFGEE